MKVLVACEFSGRVRDAFIERGHDAVSCDLLPSETPGPHYQGHVEMLLFEPEQWDMMIAFPPCTYLSKAGARWWPGKQAEQAEALDFVRLLMNAPIPYIAIENPVGRISTAIRKPDQIIEPYQFGDPWRKGTCLWLKNLPPLEPTRVVEPTGYWVGGDRVKHGEHRDPRRRSLTFTGIAEAMASQWGLISTSNREAA